MSTTAVADVPLGLVVLGCALAFLVVRLVESAVDTYRARRGQHIGDHCEHCAAVEVLGDQLQKLSEYAHDSFAVLEEIRDAIPPERAHSG